MKKIIGKNIYILSDIGGKGTLEILTGEASKFYKGKKAR